MVWMRANCSRGAWRRERVAYGNHHKRLVAILFGALAISTSAFAFTATPQPHLDSVDLTCLPPLDRRDPNPVIRIHVTAQFDEDMNVTKLDVVHLLFNGAEHNRSDQYTNDFLGRKPGYLDWSWKGTWVKNSSVTMIGHLYFNNLGWFYEETQFENYRQSFDIISPCEESK